jgi:acyl-CoA reductase-like NAD-dependent aldehyde dehydrogenase
MTFVGSTKVAKIVNQIASNNLKQVLALGVAKNHIVLLSDAHPEQLLPLKGDKKIRKEKRRIMLLCL